MLKAKSRTSRRATTSDLVAVLAVLVVAAGVLAGCAARTPVRVPSVLEQPLPEPDAPTYLLQSGDQLAIRFYGSPELDEEQPIRPDGLISLPFVGQVKAGGLTPGELEDELVRLYTGELASPRINVIVRSFSQQRIYVGGEVGAQGAYDLSGGLTLMQAIQEAGGFLTSARRKQVIVIRRDENGEAQGRAVDMVAVLSGRSPGDDVELRAQDIIFVPRTKITNIGNFVEQYIRGALPIEPGLAVAPR